MTQKITRGTLITFTSIPRDAHGQITDPDSVVLYLNYKHADQTIYTDPPLAMNRQTDGSWTISFDTEVCENGPAFASIRATNPAGADDIKFSIEANPANPDP